MYVDLGIAVLLCIAAIIGFAKGVLSQLISLVAFVTAVFSSLWLQRPVAAFAGGWLRERMPETAIDQRMVQFATVVLLFCLIYFAVGSVLEICKRALLHTFGLRFSDRFYGMLVGLAKGLAVALLIIAGIQWSQPFASRMISREAYERWQGGLEESVAYGAGCQAIASARNRWPQLSTWMERAGASLQSLGAAVTNQPPAQALAMPAAKPAAKPTATPGTAPPPAPAATPRAKPAQP